MKSLKQIKEDYAVYHGYLDWNELIYSNDDPNYIDKCNDEIAKLYAKEVAKQALINASESATIIEGDCGEFGMYTPPFVNKKTILNESNIPKL